MLGGFFVLWELVYLLWNPGDDVLPSPAAVARKLDSQWSVLISHSGATFIVALIGFATAIAGGFLAGVALHVWSRFAAVAWPTILAAQTTPKIAIAPILLAWFGIGMVPKVTIAVLLAFFPIMATTYAGLSSLPSEHVDLAKSMGIRRIRFFFHFELPNALPHVLTGAKLSLTFSVVGAVTAEFVGSDTGLGYLIRQGSGELQTDLVFAATVILVALVFALYGLLSLVERRTVWWDLARRRAANDDAIQLPSVG